MEEILLNEPAHLCFYVESLLTDVNENKIGLSIARRNKLFQKNLISEKIVKNYDN